MTPRSNGRRPATIFIAFLAALYCILIAAFFWSEALASIGFVRLDSMVYYAGARLAAVSDLDRLFDPERFTAYLNEVFAARLPRPFVFAPWLYPPSYLLLIAPLSTLPFAWFYVVFEVATGAAAAISLGSRRSFAGWGVALAVLLAPAACANLVVGQNAFLSLALLLGGVRLLHARPLAAGVLLGLMTYKPQLCLMLPVALLASRAWRPLVTAALTAGALAIVSAAVFGLEAWPLWIGEFVHSAATFQDKWFANGMNNGFSVYVCAILFGASPTIASIVQLLAAAVCATAVFWTFKQTSRWQIRAAVLFYAVALSSPHFQFYELTLVSAAATLTFELSLVEGSRLGEPLLLAIVWALPLMRPNFHPAFRLAPLAIAALLAYAVARVQAAGAAPKATIVTTSGAGRGNI